MSIFQSAAAAEALGKDHEARIMINIIIPLEYI